MRALALLHRGLWTDSGWKYMGSAPLLQVGGARCVDAVLLLLLPTQLLGLLAAASTVVIICSPVPVCTITAAVCVWLCHIDLRDTSVLTAD